MLKLADDGLNLIVQKPMLIYCSDFFIFFGAGGLIGTKLCGSILSTP